MFKNLNLPWKINLIVTLTIILILSIIAYVIYDFTSEIVLNQINEKIDIMTSYQKKLLTELIEREKEKVKKIAEDNNVWLYTDYANYIQQNEEDIQNLEDYHYLTTFNELIKSTSLVRELGKKLNNILMEIPYAEIVYITTPDGVVIADSRYTLSKEVSENIYTGIQLQKSRYKDLNFGELAYFEGKPLLLLNAPIYNNNEIIGYSVVGISTEIFRQNLDTLLGEYGTITLINDKGVILNHNQREMIGNKFNNAWYINLLGQDINMDKEILNGNYNILNKIKGRNFYFAIEIPLKNINSLAIKIRNIILFISIIGIVIVFVVTSFSINWQLKPIDRLLMKMDKVSQGDMDTKINIDRRDEIGRLAYNFNKMVNDIKSLLQKVKNDQEEIRKIEFKALQSQINPHFLYNTLDFIYWMTISKKYNDIADMAIALSNFFRLALNNGKDITTIGNEIKHVKNYLLIQKLRYPDKFKSEIKVDKEIFDNQCIKLILQPLVENSLLHGLNDVESGGLIEIICTKKGQEVLLEVCDNGCGFDVEKMEKIIENKDNINTGYALKNVHSRIQLYYGNDYGLSFARREDGGACVKINIPLVKEEGNENV